jgi:hypothetical protein
MLENFKSNSKYTTKQILKDNWEWFYNKHRNNPTTGIRDVVVKNVEKVMACGDKDKLGYSLYVCSCCGGKKYVAHTCKSRFCNSCGKVMTDKWIKYAQSELLNTPYYHIVFSPPSELWWIFRSQPKMP